MSEINGIAKEIVKTIREDKNKGTKPYDTQATVMRVEDGTAWVRIPGGVDETPAQLTMDAKEGDNVQVRVSGGRAWLAGNGTSPPTDDTKAVEANENAKSASIAARAAFNAAENAQTDAERAHHAAEQAETDAAKAKTSAGEAKTQASAANSYAVGALNSLSTTQDIMGVLSWVEESIKYVWDYPPTAEDKEYDPSKQYYTVIGKRVIDPIETDYDKYYVLNSESEPASKTGNIVTFDSDLDNFPLKSLTATINPKQSGSGDPSPDNVRPISGWESVSVYKSGKNLVNYSDPQNQNAYINREGNILSSGNWRVSPMIKIAPSKPYVLSGLTAHPNSGTDNFRTYDADGNYIGVVTKNISTYPITFNENVAYVQFCWHITDNSTVMFEQGTTATDYEPYQADTYTTDLPETVYGGSLDVVNGVLTVTHAFYTFTGNENPYIQQTGRVAIKAFRGSAIAGSSVPAVCTHFSAVVSGEYAYITTTMAAEELKTFMGNNMVTIVYELAEPRTIQLTPKQITTLLGTNNVWADSGDVTVEYWDGPVGYVTPTSSFDPTETYYTVKGSPVKIDESKQEEHGKGLYYVHDLTNAKEAMADFIKARLALTDKGLYVVGGDTENEGYKILLASDGMTVYDAQGVAVSKFGENIEFSSTRAQYIGNEDAFIVFNPTTAEITIGGDVLIDGTKRLSDVLTDLDVSVTQTATGADITVNGDTVSIANGQAGEQGPKGDTGAKGDTGDTGPEAIVTVSVTEINYIAKTATLSATLRVDGVVTTPTSYKWTKGTSTTSLGTGATLNVTDLNAVYNCTATW